MIQLKEVDFHYDLDTPTPVPALEGISLSIAPETSLGVVGRSGSGKTTLLQVMSGVLLPTAGRVLLDGRDLASSADLQRRACLSVGLVFQFPERQLFEATVFDDIAFGPRSLGFDKARIEACVREPLRQVGLDPDRFGSRPPLELSFGEMRRVALAGILVLKPRVLLLDEPTAGLDEEGRAALGKLLVSLHRAGTGVVIASHNLAFLTGIVRDLVVLERGRQVMQGPALDVLLEPDRLREMGMEIPFVPELLSRLRARGWPLELGSLAEKEVVEALVAAAVRGRA